MKTGASMAAGVSAPEAVCGEQQGRAGDGKGDRRIEFHAEKGRVALRQAHGFRQPQRHHAEADGNAP